MSRACFLVLLCAMGCGDDTGPSELAPGTARYTSTRVGQADTKRTFTGTSDYRPDGLPTSVQFELSADSPGLPNYQMNLYHYGTVTLSKRQYAVTGDESGNIDDDVFYVHGSHVIRGDPRTSGTLTITKIEDGNYAADFSYIGPVDSAGVEWYVEVKGSFSAKCEGSCP